MSKGNSLRNYYCNKKFWHLKIDLESRNTYNCHASAPHRIDFEWLSKNPGQLFNIPINVHERQQMLQNVRNSSCEQNCWYAEDRDQTSPRLKYNGNLRTHDQIFTQPRVLDLVLTSDCNLTCSYCCKEFSKAWRTDLDKFGDYPLSDSDDPRYKLLDTDRVLMKISQPELLNTRFYNLLLDEIRKMLPQAEKLVVTGGEPFLNNNLIDLLKNVELLDTTIIDIFTGLGVNSDRFCRMLDKLAEIPNVVLWISAENIEKHFEFNRYGISWNQFENNLQHIRDRKLQFRFHSTLTNLTVFGFKKFWQRYQNETIGMQLSFQPRMQTVHVIDAESKNLLLDEFKDIPDEFRSKLVQSLQSVPEDEERRDMAIFVSEFVRRRPLLDLRIYPKSFLDWLGLKNVV